MSYRKKFDARALTMLGLFIAVEVVLSRFCSISAWNVKIGLGFLPVAAAALLYGPLSAGIVGALSDFLGATLFPIGPYFPGFTFTSFLTGVVFGLFLYRRQSAPRILGAVAVNQLILSLVLNTFWISFLYGSPFLSLMPVRLLQCAVLAPVQFLTIGVMTRSLKFYYRKKAVQ